MAIISGNANSEVLDGTAQADSITFSQGGQDTVHGFAGADSIYAGAALDAKDQVDGGKGYDWLDLNGDYAAGVTFKANTLTNIEEIHFSGGFDYKLTTHDNTIAAGKVLKLDAYNMLPGSSLSIDGSAEKDGSFLFYDGRSNDKVIGGAQSDTLSFGYGGNDEMHGGGGDDVLGGALTAQDTVDGGEGNDVLYLRDDYSAGLTFAANTVQSVESIGLLDDFSYSLITIDATVAAGKDLYVSGWGISGTHNMKFNGSAETDGTFSFTDSANNDSIRGGAQGDRYDTYMGGSDILSGMGGNDSFNMGGALDATDIIFGGEGDDRVSVDGDYSAGIKLGIFSLIQVENLQVAGGHDYKFTTNDFNVEAGKTLNVSASSLGAKDTIYFDGSAETNGNFQFFSGQGNDSFIGGAGDDYLDAHTGGTDRFVGGDGDDAVSFFGAYTMKDFADGGAGNDRMYLYGQFDKGLAFGAANVQNMESITLGNGYSYDVTALNSLVKAGETIAFDTYYSEAGESFTFDGSAETDGHFRLTGGMASDFLTGGAQSDDFSLNRGGNDTMNGGGGNDLFRASEFFTALDRINGGAGFDTVELSGDFSGGRTLQANTLQSIEQIDFFYGNDYKLTLNDGTVAAGKTLTLDGHFLAAGDTISFDATSESDGRFDVVTGAGNDNIQTGSGNDHIATGEGSDVLNGGEGNDWLTGGGGKDFLDGGSGNDHFIFTALTDSAPGQSRDVIEGWDDGDKIDVSAIDTAIAAGDQGFAFIGTSAFSATGIAELRYGTNNGNTFVHADADGDGTVDMQIAIQGVHVLNLGDFIL